MIEVRERDGPRISRRLRPREKLLLRGKRAISLAQNDADGSRVDIQANQIEISVVVQVANRKAEGFNLQRIRVHLERAISVSEENHQAGICCGDKVELPIVIEISHRVRSAAKKTLVDVDGFLKGPV